MSESRDPMVGQDEGVRAISIFLTYPSKTIDFSLGTFACASKPPICPVSNHTLRLSSKMAPY